jgi:predicted transcriptional regulator
MNEKLSNILYTRGMELESFKAKLVQDLRQANLEDIRTRSGVARQTLYRIINGEDFRVSTAEKVRRALDDASKAA